MNKKKTIRRALVISACLLAGCGVASLLIAANRKEATHYCKGIAVAVNGADDKAYIDKDDILKQLQAVAKGGIVSKSVKTIDVALLERALEKHPLIRDAELYFDTQDVLHVSVSERVPVARVFTTGGGTFYLDSAGQRMPLLPNVHVRVPVVTGFTNAKRLHKKDSVVAREATAIARYVGEQPFWNAQIAQIDITPAGTFELLPVVGNHIIRIGRAEGLEEKLANLLLFYKQVLRNTGFDKYAIVDVQFKDQVIGSNEKGTAIDSVQLQRNIQELIKRTKLQAEADSLAAIEINKELMADSMMQMTPGTAAGAASKPIAAAGTPRPDSENQKSNPVKKVQSDAGKKTAQQPAPKAVLRKRNS